MLEESLVEVVEDASQDSSKGRSENIHGQVVSHYALWVHIIAPGLEEGAANCKGWVKTRSSECIHLAESPKDEADSGDSPDAHVRSDGLLTSGVKDEKNEDECADDFHIQLKYATSHVIVLLSQVPVDLVDFE